MTTNLEFTFNSLRSQFQKALDFGYNITSCQDYIANKERYLCEKTIVNRVDIDFSVRKAERLLDIFQQLNIKASFFVRLHAPEYNIFSFENYRIIKRMIKEGHEIGYHSEIMDQAAIWQEDPTACLLRDIDTLNRIFDINIQGVASHGGITGINNLDFWKNRTPQEFGLTYEAYDKHNLDLFDHALYISDSEWYRWKAYDKGLLLEHDRRSFGEHLNQRPKLIYLLIHSDTYYDIHPYEPIGA